MLSTSIAATEKHVLDSSGPRDSHLALLRSMWAQKMEQVNFPCSITGSQINHGSRSFSLMDLLKFSFVCCYFDDSLLYIYKLYIFIIHRMRDRVYCLGWIWLWISPTLFVLSPLYLRHLFYPGLQIS